MRHRKDIRKLGRPTKQRKALREGLMCSLIVHGRIETTEARAKEIRPHIERLITKGKNKTLASQRLIISRLGGNRGASHKLLEEIAPRYKERRGGYTRIVTTGVRKDDAAQNAVIEFV